MSTLTLSEAISPARWELAGPAPCTDAELQRENIANLCTSMLWLRSWWESHQDVVRALNEKAAAEVHDHFIDGAICARSVARGMALELDEQRIKNYRWGTRAQTLRRVVRVAVETEGRAL